MAGNGNYAHSFPGNTCRLQTEFGYLAYVEHDGGGVVDCFSSSLLQDLVQDANAAVEKSKHFALFKNKTFVLGCQIER